MQVEVSKYTEGVNDKAFRPNGLPKSLIRYDGIYHWLISPYFLPFSFPLLILISTPLKYSISSINYYSYNYNDLTCQLVRRLRLWIPLLKLSKLSSIPNLPLALRVMTLLTTSIIFSLNPSILTASPSLVDSLQAMSLNPPLPKTPENHLAFPWWG
jgi:hypothetical protein